MSCDSTGATMETVTPPTMNIVIVMLPVDPGLKYAEIQVCLVSMPIGDQHKHTIYTTRIVNLIEDWLQKTCTQENISETQ